MGLILVSRRPKEEAAIIIVLSVQASVLCIANEYPAMILLST